MYKTSAQMPDARLSNPLDQRINISKHRSQKLLFFIGRFPPFVTSVAWEVIFADTDGQLGVMGEITTWSVRLSMCLYTRA